MTGQRRAVPAEQGDRVALAHPGLQPADQPQDAGRRRAGRRLHGRERVDVVDDPQAVARVDEQVRRVVHRPARPDQVPDRVDQEARRVEHGPIGERLPADDPDAPTMDDALVAELLSQGARPIAGLGRQAEVLVQDDPHRQGRRSRRPDVLVAHEDRRLAVRADHEDRLLEAGVEPGQPRQAGAVLAVGVDHEPVVPAGGHPLAQGRQTLGVARGGDLRRDGRTPEVGERDRRQPGRQGCHVSTSWASRRIVANRFASIRCHGPTSPSGQVTRTSASSPSRARHGSSRGGR